MAGGEGGDVGAEAPVKTMQQDEYNPVIQSSTISCPVCAENIPSSSAVCPICAETLAIAQPSPPAKTSPSGHNKAPDNSIASTRENTMEEVLEELEKVNKNLSLIAKHLLFD